MNSLVFPFRYEYVLGVGRVFTSKVRIGLKTDLGLIKLDFILDTGADYTTLPNFMAKKLGIDLSHQKKTDMVGLGGHVVDAWLVKVDLWLSETESVLVSAVITDENSTPLLLGRADILDKLFSWNFDCKKKSIIFEKS